MLFISLSPASAANSHAVAAHDAYAFSAVIDILDYGGVKPLEIAVAKR